MQRSIASRLRGFRRDHRGIAATEFALFLPIALLGLIGEYTLCESQEIARKVTITANSIVDLVARQTSVTTNASNTALLNVTTLLNAAAQIAAPYPTSNMKIVLAEITTDSNNNTTVTWSQTLNGTALTPGNSFTLPSGMAQANTSLIYATVTYTYSPPLGYVLTGQIPISNSFYMNPYSATSVPLTN
jgi:Flp pilus assembly protein TadG